MGEIRISIPSENLGFPYPVCKKTIFCFADGQVVSETVRHCPDLIERLLS